MPLTPKEIEQKTFTASFRGYAEDEVDHFLEEVIVSVTEYQQMIRDRDARLADSGAGRGPTDVAGANDEAKRILQAAKRQAEQILDGARASALEIESGAVAPASALSPEQAADRERLVAGYTKLRGELSAVRSRVQKALTASQEAFGIMEGQVGSLLAGASAEPTAPEAVPPAAQGQSAGGAIAAEYGTLSQPAADEGQEELELPSGQDTESSRPRRPWER